MNEVLIIPLPDVDIPFVIVLDLGYINELLIAGSEHILFL